MSDQQKSALVVHYPFDSIIAQAILFLCNAIIRGAVAINVEKYQLIQF